MKLRTHTGNTFKKIILLLWFTVTASCSSLQAGIYELSIDQNNGDVILSKEPDVKYFLEYVYEFPENFTVTAFNRSGIKYSIKKTKLLNHSYYTLTDTDGNFHTLSFYGTKAALYSEGAWAMDTDADMNSYKSYLEGKNVWDVQEIKTDKGIDTERTVFNILRKINSNVTYYYKDHLSDKPNVDNCNTALQETIVEKILWR
jgi:hypothetical protein